MGIIKQKQTNHNMNKLANLLALAAATSALAVESYMQN